MNTRGKLLVLVALLAALAAVAALPLAAQSGGRLESRNARVTFQSNVPGAIVSLNGMRVGETPLTILVKPGRYSLSVRARGYQPYAAAVQITNQPSQVITVTLRSTGFSVQITANVLNASVYIDGRFVGSTPANLDLAPGRYSLRIQADGYRTLETTLEITREEAGRRFVFNLVPAISRVIIRVPDAYLEPAGPVPRIRIFVDNRLVANRITSVQLEVQPGVHNIRISSIGGGLSLSEDLAFEAGRTYELRLTMGLVVE
jgi:hypothetical protein